MHKASIGIYQRNIEQDHISCPLVPDQLFEAVKRVCETKQTEILRLSDGVFILTYSENGPFSDVKMKDWLPVQIMRLKQWSSGGVKVSEMQDFDPEWNHVI